MINANQDQAKDIPLPEEISGTTYTNLDSELGSFARIYYETNYSRIERLESQRLTITNVVITLSVVAFTFGGLSASSPSFDIAMILPIIVVVINLFAMFYVIRSLSYIEVHRLRATKVLERYAEEVVTIDEEFPWPVFRLSLGLTRVQAIIHLLIVIVVSALVVYSIFS